MAIKKVGSAITNQPAVGGESADLPGLVPDKYKYATPPDPSKLPPKTGAAKLADDHPHIFRSVVLLGFEMVDVTDEGETLKFRCRTKLDGRLLFSRLQLLLLHTVGVEFGKEYLIKGGGMVYAWYVRVRKDVTDLAKIVSTAVDHFPVPVRGTKVYGGNPPGKLLTKSNAVPPSTGAGVVPDVTLGSVMPR